MTPQEILMEYCKCIANPIYAIEKYLRTQDVSSGGYVPFKLFDKQKELVDSYENFQQTIATKSRQAGVTTTTAAYFAIKSVLAPKNSPEKLVIITNRLDSSQKILDQVREFITQFCENSWVIMDIENPNPYIKISDPNDIFLTNSKKEIVLAHNNSSIKAISSGKNSSRTLTATFLLFDEAAFIDNGDLIYRSARPLIATGGKVSMISTANGRDPLYFPTYEGSLKKGDECNGFNLVEMRWYMDPRFNKDLEWTKEDCENVKEKDFTLESYKEMVDDGYKPTSSWYRNMCAGYSWDKKSIAQELDVDFLNSGGNAVSDLAQKKQREENVIEKPKFEDPDYPEMWIWKTPDEVFGKKIIMSIDVASGSGADNSSIEILAVDCVDDDGNQYVEQLAEYYGKISKDELGVLGFKYAEIYDCFVVIDCIGGHGDIPLKYFIDNKYTKKLYKDVIKNQSSLYTRKNKFGLNNNLDKPYGFWNPSHRQPMCKLLAHSIETNKIKIRSLRVMNELETWVWKNERIDHERTKHDDALMALAMAMFVFENSYGDIKMSTSTINATLSVFSGGSYVITKNKENKKNKLDKNKNIKKFILPIYGGSYGNMNSDKMNINDFLF